MTNRTAFRVHFEGDDVPPYDTFATSPEAARDAAKGVWPGELVRKVKRIRSEEMESIIKVGTLPLALEMAVVHESQTPSSTEEFQP
ncbi:MAG TPA: hypothetical protein VGN93_31195 [Shinella sp.]|jgi:hypothetical protein|uniref:hypothetical protein n=1 Tax=Shinella sp. TaxID=1870904 RepID=UPI002E0F93D4|nr:hypothetical protein [Shinella sp.]